MPHVVIECSENLLSRLRQQEVCKKACDVLLQSGLFKASEMRVRLYPVADSYVGIKGGDGSFVHALIYCWKGARQRYAKILLRLFMPW